MKSSSFIRYFKDISIEDLNTVGGKNASLGEMFNELKCKGIKIPDGFAITSHAYWYFLRFNDLDTKISQLLNSLKEDDLESLRLIGKQIRHEILSARFPPDLKDDIVSAYEHFGITQDVAVRSSATAEDLPDASFAGQQETYLNVQGKLQLLDSCRRCFASLFTDRAISYRTSRNFSHMKVALSICVQQMVRSDLACSGVMFSIDPETGFENAILINASYGLGESIVQGSVNPDEYCVFKPTLKNHFKPILQKVLGSKEFKLVYDVDGARMVKNIPVPEHDRHRFVLDDDEILKLASWACVIEDHYSKKKKQFTPMDIEWAKDGKTGELYIVQARPETVHSQDKGLKIDVYTIKEKKDPLVTGRSIGEKIGVGKVRIINTVDQIHKFREGEILVTDRTDPDWEPVMKKAKAIVTNRGGRTCHAAIISREMGVPAVVGTEIGTDVLQDGMLITVSCAEGELGKIYEGKLAYEVEEVEVGKTHQPKTKILMNLGNPEEAFRLSGIPNEGVGLAREEFIVSSYIKIHPKALINFESLKDKALKQKIQKMTASYDDKKMFFVDKLSQGVAMIAAAFYPNDVIVRLSDFKSNEYAGLVGGKEYEPHEENPMLGFRGASRYLHPEFSDCFKLECQAMLKVRKTMGLTNVKLMIPFCRTPEEGRKVIAEMARNGLKQGKDGLEIYVMCELPSNVILAEEFAEIFDGFSIGSNDLTQLTLGVDRDSEIVASIFDERNEAVKAMISRTIRVAKEKKIKVGICGQAPSDYPEIAEFLVHQGIDSISLNPDSVIKMMAKVKKVENKLHMKKTRTAKTSGLEPSYLDL